MQLPNMIKGLCSLIIALLMITIYSDRIGAASNQIEPDKLAAESDVNQQWYEADRLAQQLYQYSVSGELDKAEQAMNEIEALFAQNKLFDGLSMERVRALSTTVLDAKWELDRIQVKQELLIEAASRLHLAIDAKTHAKKAMWLQYEQVLRQEMSDMLQAQSVEQWQRLSKEWAIHIERIMPAVTMQRPNESVEMLRSLVALIQKTNSNEVSIEQAKDALRQVEETWLHEVFGRVGEKAAWAIAGSSDDTWRTMMWLACFVSVTLAYVGYMKYRHLNEDIHSNPWQ